MSKRSAQPGPFNTSLSRRIVIALAAAVCAAAGSAAGRGTGRERQTLQPAPRLSVPSATSGHAPRTPDELAQRIAAISARYLGVPYRLDPLGEGPNGDRDADPLVCHTAVDCQTFVEQVLAEALAPGGADHLPLLTRIRYRDGVVGFGSRNHYMVTDWLPQNRWFLRDLTARIGVKQVRTMEKVIDRPAFFRSRGAPALAEQAAVQRSRTAYIPRRALLGVMARVPNGAVLIWVQDRPGIIAAHCGLAIRRPDGGIMFRHASQRRGRVVDEPLAEYLRRAPARIVGVKVCQAVPPLDTGSRRR
jgi:hypothetical protein